MKPTHLGRRIGVIAGSTAAMAMMVFTASCASEEEAPEETTTTTTTTTPAPVEPTEKAPQIDPGGPNPFGPTVFAPPAPTAIPGGD